LEFTDNQLSEQRNKMSLKNSPRSIGTRDIPGAFTHTRSVHNPHDIMSTEDIDGSKPSRFRHRGFDRKDALPNAKYSGLFDSTGKRIGVNELEKHHGHTDPLAPSQLRKKEQFIRKEPVNEDYIPISLKNLRLSRRNYCGVRKNQSNMYEFLRELPIPFQNRNLKITPHHSKSVQRMGSSQNRTISHHQSPKGVEEMSSRSFKEKPIKAPSIHNHSVSYEIAPQTKREPSLP